MVYEHNEKNIVGRIVWAVGPNGQNELFLPFEDTCKNKKGVGGNLNIKKIQISLSINKYPNVSNGNFTGNHGT